MIRELENYLSCQINVMWRIMSMNSDLLLGVSCLDRLICHMPWTWHYEWNVIVSTTIFRTRILHSSTNSTSWLYKWFGLSASCTSDSFLKEGNSVYRTSKVEKQHTK